MYIRPILTLTLSIFCFGCQAGDAGRAMLALDDGIALVDGAAKVDQSMGSTDMADGGIDTGNLPTDASAAPMDSVVVPSGCAHLDSPREAGLTRVVDCRLTQGARGNAPMRGVVVSGDVLLDPLSTSPHSLSHFEELKAAGIDMVWLLVTWKGLQPVEGTYDGAYMGRICTLGEAAQQAGLKVVMGGYHSGIGLRTVDGLPRWIVGDVSSIFSAWSAIWRDHGDGLRMGWERLLNTCAGKFQLLGLQVLASPVSNQPAADAARVRAILEAVHGTADTLFGPVLRFVEPLRGPDGSRVRIWSDIEPDIIFSPALWPLGEAPGVAIEPGRVEALVGEAAEFGIPVWIRAQAANTTADQGEQLGQMEAFGVGYAIWHDGFGSEFALRDVEGRPNPLWDNAFRRPWPLSLNGRNLSMGIRNGAWHLRWTSVSSRLEVVRIFVGAARAAHTVRHSIEGVEDFESAYDPVTEEVTILIQAPAGHREILIEP